MFFACGRISFSNVIALDTHTQFDRCSSTRSQTPRRPGPARPGLCLLLSSYLLNFVVGSRTKLSRSFAVRPSASQPASYRCRRCRLFRNGCCCSARRRVFRTEGSAGRPAGRTDGRTDGRRSDEDKVLEFFDRAPPADLRTDGPPAPQPGSSSSNKVSRT